MKVLLTTTTSFRRKFRALLKTGANHNEDVVRESAYVFAPCNYTAAGGNDAGGTCFSEASRSMVMMDKLTVHMVVSDRISKNFIALCGVRSLIAMK